MTDQNTFAIAELQQKANDGDAQVQLELAFCYADLLGNERNNELALAWLKKAAEQGLANAQLALGFYYTLGKSGEHLDKFCDRSFSWVIGRCAPMDLAMACDSRYWSNGGKRRADHELAFTWFKKAAVQNCAEAQYWLARCYYYGIGIEQSDENAFQLFNKAAEQGFVEAQYHLARCYFEGKGVEQNDGLAFEWLKKAAEQDFADAQRCLAFCYLDGKGVEQNAIIAVEWIIKSAENEYPYYSSSLNTAEAYLLLAELYDEGIIVEKNKELALKWHEKGEKLIFPYRKEDYEKDSARYQLEFTETWSKVYCRLARFYLKDKCATNYNFAHGMEYRLKAVETGHTFAEDWSEDQYQLALCYFEGKGVEKSYEHGMKWMISAAAQGHVEANNWFTNAYLSLAIPSCLSDKEGGEQYYKFAADWCIKELDGHNSAEAYLLLGVLYYSGKGVEQSDERALECFKKAQYISDNCYPDAVRNENLDAFIQLYLSNCSAQGKDVAKLDCTYRTNYLPESYLTLLGEIFLKGIIDMPFHNLEHNKVFLTLLRISVFKKAGEYELAKEFTKEIFDKTEGMDKNFKEVLLTGIEQEQEIAEKNKALESEIKQKEALYKALHEKEKEMLSFFTHTMRNALATAPQSLREAIDLLGGCPRIPTNS